jgi:hypothetical protein
MNYEHLNYYTTSPADSQSFFFFLKRLVFLDHFTCFVHGRKRTPPAMLECQNKGYAGVLK